MRILFVNEKIGYSSTTSYSLDLLLALAERGHDVRLATVGGEFKEVFKEAGIDTYLVRYNYFSFRKLLQFLGDFDPEFVHSLNLRSLPMAEKITDRLEKPLSVTIHHIPSDHVRLRARKVVGVIAVNEAVREALVNSQSVPKELIRVVRSGVSLEKFSAGSPSLSSGRVPVIGSVGRLDPVKGYAYLIAAARKVLDAGHEAMFVICGDGEDETHLRRQIKELDLEKAVTLCPPMPDMPELVRNFDVVVVPTLRGGVGLAALEAMTMERPVIASAVGEIVQFVTDDQSGILVRPRDPDALAEKIVYLLEHPEEARRLGENAREWVGKNLPLTQMVDDTEAFFKDLSEA